MKEKQWPRYARPERLQGCGAQEEGHGCHAFAAEPSGPPCFLRPAAKACLSLNQPISSGRTATAAAASGACRRATSPLHPSQAVRNCPSLMPRPLGTLAAMSAKPTLLLAPPPAGSIPALGPVSGPCPSAKRHHQPTAPLSDPRTVCAAVTRRFSDRALMASGHRQQTAFFGAGTHGKGSPSDYGAFGICPVLENPFAEKTERNIASWPSRPIISSFPLHAVV